MTTVAIADLAGARATFMRSLLPEAAPWFAAGLPEAAVVDLFPQSVTAWQGRLLAGIWLSVGGEADVGDLLAEAVELRLATLTMPRATRQKLFEHFGLEITSAVQTAGTVGSAHPLARVEIMPWAFDAVSVVVDILAAWLAGFKIGGRPNELLLLAGVVDLWTDLVG